MTIRYQIKYLDDLAEKNKDLDIRWDMREAIRAGRDALKEKQKRENSNLLTPKLCDKVLNGLQCHADTDLLCGKCPYEGTTDCGRRLATDAAELIKSLQSQLTAYKPYEPCDCKSLQTEADKVKQLQDDNVELMHELTTKNMEINKLKTQCDINATSFFEMRRQLAESQARERAAVECINKIVDVPAGDMCRADDLRQYVYGVTRTIHEWRGSQEGEVKQDE